MRLFCLILIFLFSGTQTLLAAQKPAEVVFLNGNIYTLSEAQAQAEALVVQNGKLVFVGSAKAARRYIGKSTK
ncbi:MAG TPA: amidohydrolase, partial [Acidobacteriota bacterium]|nr:amidohydrolase [Acidobacteriota bacterium]